MAELKRDMHFFFHSVSYEFCVVIQRNVKKRVCKRKNLLSEEETKLKITIVGGGGGGGGSKSAKGGPYLLADLDRGVQIRGGVQIRCDTGCQTKGYTVSKSLEW